MNIVKTILILSLLIPYSAYAACGGSSPNLIAASANQSDVAACVAVSTYGDIIRIPACAVGSCVWTSGIKITKDIRIVGAGASSTVLTNGQTGDYSYPSYFRFQPDATAVTRLSSLSSPADMKTQIFEVTGIHFYDSSQHVYVYPVLILNASWNSSTTPIKRIRVHHNTFTNTTVAVKVMGYIHGLFDNNTLNNSGAHYSEGIGVGHWTHDLRHIGTSEAWYVEDNTFNGLSNINFTIGAAASKGFSHVLRYNTVIDNTNGFQPWESHTPAPQFTEVYGNKTIANTMHPQIRGGVGLVYFNQAETDNAVLLREEYSDFNYYSGDWSDALPPIAGECAYATAYNPRAGTSPQICNDSIDPGTDCTCKKVNHTYIWNNRRAAGTLQTAAVSTDAWNTDAVQNNTGGAVTFPELVENREYFNHTASFNGTAGMGCGTLAQMNAITPTLANAGFWVTTQNNCSSLSANNIGVSPTTPIAGTLYRWNGSSWVSYYTPYTYPHPLTAPSPPRNLRIR